MSTTAKPHRRKHHARERRADAWSGIPSPVGLMILRLERLLRRAEQEGADQDAAALAEATRVMRLYFGR